MTIKILCTGDIHLGRTPTRLKTDEHNSELFSPRHVLQKTVSLAKEMKVDMVALTGDLLEHSGAYLEAYSALYNGVHALQKSNIPIYAVAGNHDFDSLKRLHKDFPDFNLLGTTNGWDEKIVRLRETPLRIQGKSFLSSHSRTNPLLDYQPPGDEIPTIALLHCDVGSAQSDYAPVQLQDLKDRAPTAWLLGHIHKAECISATPLILYPGSLQPLDPGETGVHGPWLIEVDNHLSARAVQYPLATVRYETIEVALKKEEQKELSPLIAEQLRKWHEANNAYLVNVNTLACRILLSGQIEYHNHIPSLIEKLENNNSFPFENVNYFIEKCIDKTTPAISLDKTAKHKDLPGLLARKLIILRDGQPEGEYKQLIREAKQKMSALGRNASFTPLYMADPPAEETVRTALIQAGQFVISELISQKE